MLAAYQRARTGHVQEAEQSVARTLSLHRVVDVSGDLDLTHNAVRVGGLTLLYINYGAELTIHLQSPYEPYYLVQIPLQGSMRILRDGERLEAKVGTAVITEPGHVTSRLQYSANCARLLVKIPPALVEQRLHEFAGTGRADELGRALPGVLDVTDGAGRTWMELVRTGVADLDAGAFMLSLPSAIGYFENLIVDGLLVVRGDGHAPADVEAVPSMRGALEFIDAHLDSPIGVLDIASATHMSIRALQIRFQRELGVSPIAYVRNRRLEAVYRDLYVGSADTSVYAVAARHGITHLGRMAAAYREKFGESPSDTLRAAAGRRGNG